MRCLRRETRLQGELLEQEGSLCAEYANIGAGGIVQCVQSIAWIRGYEHSRIQRDTVELIACPLERLLRHTNQSSASKDAGHRNVPILAREVEGRHAVLVGEGERGAESESNILRIEI